MNHSELTALLSGVKVVAVVGASDSPDRPVDRVGRYLISQGFTVVPVHPRRKEVWGLACRASLTDISEPVDLVDVFRASEHCPAHARETLKMTPLPKVFWMQMGIDSRQARDILAQSPVTVVADRCLMIEHRRLTSGATN